MKESTAAAALSLLMALPVLSQDAASATQEKIAALKQSIAQNQAALKQYSWMQTTQISLKGEVKKVEQDQCQYGPDGKVQKTSIPTAAPPEEHHRREGRLKKEIVEHKVDDLKEYMQGVNALIHDYVPPNGERIHAAHAAGNISITPAPGLDTIQIRNYNKPGDMVSIGFETATRKIRSYGVNTYLDDKDDAVTLNATFTQLPDGTNHVQQTVLDAPTKKIQVTTTNSGYARLGQ